MTNQLGQAILALVVLSATAASKPVPGSSGFTDPWVWSLTDFSGGCSPAACTWGFNITAPDYLHFPGFSASCGGNTLQNNDNYVECPLYSNNQKLSAKIGNFVEQDGHQYVQTYVAYLYTTPVLQFVAASYNFSGYGLGLYEGRISNATANFTITPTTVDIQKILI